MQREWVRWAFRVLKDTGQQAKFKELVEFVRHESDEANFLYGRSFFSVSKPPNSRPALKKSAAFGTVVSRQEVKRTESEPRVPCPFCKGRHSLVSCKSFQDMSRYKKVEFLRKQGRCFRCFQKSHLISDCQSKITCKVVGCNSALLYYISTRLVTNLAFLAPLLPADPKCLNECYFLHCVAPPGASPKLVRIS